MCCRIEELQDKQVVSIKNASVLGCVGDVEIDTTNGNLVSIIIMGRRRFLGLFGRDEDLIIPWADIEVIGNDTILVSSDVMPRISRKRESRKFTGSSPSGNY